MNPMPHYNIGGTVNNWKVWAWSLLAAANGGGANSALNGLAMPDVYNLSHEGLIHLAKGALIGALVPVLTLLKNSPLPSVQTTTQTTTLQKITTVTPAPDAPKE